MKRVKLFVCVVLFAFALGVAPSSAVAAEKGEKKSRLLRHVVMFQFKESSSEKDVQRIEKAFAELPKKIDAIHSFEWGKNNSPEELNDGLTHCFLVTFRTEKDREVYLPHAAHQEFVSILKPHLEKVLVIDYWASE